uniref:Carboxylic ester hydrolase n=1 Tax=Subpsaltria yangi TaxID=1195109 RepID=A0A2Z4HPR4_9HEMI|nr:carboxylesterase E4 [Subpsaltria yangi]
MKPWASVVMAINDGPGCIQTDVFPGFITLTGESEDCLFVNVYTPQLPFPGNTNHPKLPVMVFIHGGAFLSGAGSSHTYGPEFFMAEKNIVLVSLNYRLGVLGFLSTGTEDAQGNVGMKDQVLALKWVQKEIINFGGDPSQVTIFGESAGAGSVVLHMVSPMSKGLFHRAIAQSGTALPEWAAIDASVAVDRATRIAKSLYCNTENATTIVNCLSRMSTSALVQATFSLIAEEKTVVVTVPVVETAKFDEDVFLPDKPRNLFDNLELSSSVPLIIGVNKDEGMFFLSEDDEMYEFFDQNLQHCLPLHVRKHSTPDQREALTQKIRQFYFNNEKVDKTKLKGFVDLLGDHLFIYPTVETVRKLVEKKNYVYLYNFVHRADRYKDFWPHEVSTNLGYTGVSHGEELAFLFYSDRPVQNLTDTNSDDYKTMKKMVKLWTTFARLGTPVSSTDDTIKNIQWPKVTNSKDLVHLEMDTNFRVSHDFFKERVALWDQLTALDSSTAVKDEF